MPTNLEHDRGFISKLLTAARRLHETTRSDEVWQLADAQDYLIYLTLDALGDKELAHDLADWFLELARWLKGIAKSLVKRELPADAELFYIGFLSALGQLLSLRHELDVYLHRSITRAEFMESWKRTAKQLHL